MSLFKNPPFDRDISTHFLSCIPDGGSSRCTSVVYWLYGFSAVLFSDHADTDHYGAGNDVYSKGRSSMCE